MNTQSKKIISLLLSVMLVLSSVSGLAHAEASTAVSEGTHTVTEETVAPTEPATEATSEPTEPEPPSAPDFEFVFQEEPPKSFNTTLTGAGTEDSPYLIYTEEDLIAVALGHIENSYKHCYRLMADIELTADTWTPIGATDATAFVGIFDGNDHTISSTVLFQSTGMSGIFGINNGTIKNLNITVTIAEVATDTGALVAVNYGTVENCYSSGSIAATTSKNIGGLVGYNQGLVTLCGSSVTVTAPSSTVGGLVGKNDNNGVVRYSYATGDVTGNTVGGLIGEQYAYYDTAKTLSCYALGKVTGTANAGGLIGYTHAYTGTTYAEYSYAKGLVVSGSHTGGLIGRQADSVNVRFCYYNKTNTGNKIGFGISISDLKKQEEFYGWNFDNIWAISSDVNEGYPYISLRGEEEIVISGIGSQLDPYVIENETQLFYLSARKLSGSMSAYYILANDITVTANFWTPIARYATFTGTFDGNGHTIYGINISNTDFSNSGLFNNNSGTIKNLTVSAATIVGNANTGAIVGVNNGTISNCFVTESEISNASDGYVGGMAGWNNALITECGVDCDVVSENATVGGLLGKNENNAVVQYCYSSGDITGSCAGGLIGEQYAYYDTSKTHNCYSLGKVTGTSRVGGLIGYTHAYTGTTYVEYCYARGLVAGNKNTGGLIGSAADSFVVRYSYYNHSNTGNKIGFSTSPASMKKTATLYGWDFDNIWTIESGVNSGYPIVKLRGETPAIVLEGSGDEDDPYLIHNEKELWALVLDSGDYKLSVKNHYKLANDIVVTAAHWTPIGANGTNVFSGTFDGDGYTISGIKLSNNFYDYIGLFGYNSGTIKNLNVEATIEGVNYAGGLVAYNTGKISSCASSGSVVNASDRYSGGLVGFNVGTVELSNSCATVGDSNDIAGGLVGQNDNNGIVRYSYASGDVTGNNAGGLIGEQYAYYDVTKTLNCYALGKVTGTTRAGGLIGYTHAYTGKTCVEYCYARGLVAGSKNTGGLIGHAADNYVARYSYYNQVNTGNKIGFPVPVTAMLAQSTFYMWNFDNIWAISADVGEGTPYINLRGKITEYELEGYGDADDPYLIYTERDLWALVDGTYDLTAKLYYQLQNDITVTANYWTPIGANGYVNFNGVFDGNGYTVSGLRFSNNYYGNVGFIGVNTGTVKNLNVEVIFEGTANVGAICGQNNGTVENCTSTGSITNNASSQSNAGGLVGYNTSAVTNSHSDVIVYAPNHNAGGLVGMNDNNGTVQYCYATGNVTGKNAGGLIGEQYAYYDSAKACNSYALGDVNGTTNAGGLIGYTHAYTGTTYAEYCYSNGKVSGSKNKGGLIGRVADRITVTSSYYNSTLSEMTDIDRGTPLDDNTMKLQASYVGWDFDTVWSIESAVNGGYPYIWTMQPSETVNVTGVTLDCTEKAMQVGDVTTLVATVSPSNALNKTLIWTTDNADVAYVSNGLVTACAAGTAVITVKTADGDFTATCTVTVTEDVPPVVNVESVTLDKNTLSVTIGSTAKLTATVLPTNATNKGVTWTSSNTSIAKVDENGTVTGVKAGNVIITVKTADGSKTATCKVTVTASAVSVSGVSLNQTTLVLNAGDTAALTATITPSNATNKNVTWVSSNPSVATVSSTGTVTAVNAGTTVITVTTADGSYQATCTVTVNEAQAPHTHSYSAAETTAPTCDKAGVMTYTCTCGHSYTEEIPTTAHTEETIPAVESTCTSTGLTEGKQCSVCGTVTVPQTQTAKKFHTADSGTVTQEATCGTAGTLVYACVDCGEVLSTQSLAATGRHEWGKWTVTVAPTLEEDGTEERSCSVCGQTESRSVEYKGEIVAVTGVLLNHTSLSLTAGESAALTATVLPENATNKAVIWTSSDEDIVSVVDGVITARGIGTALITVTTADAGKSASCAVTVTQVEFDEAEPYIELTSTRARTGETLTVDVNFINNPGIVSFALSIDYDETVLRLDTVALNPAIGGMFSYGTKAVWLGSEDIHDDGCFLTLTFTVLDDAAVGSTPVSVSYEAGDIGNSSEEMVMFGTKSGMVTVYNYLPGDINGDGTVNNKDLNRLLKYLAGEDVDVVAEALDVNGDGYENNMDLIRLMKYLAGEDVIIY